MVLKRVFPAVVAVCLLACAAHASPFTGSGGNARGPASESGFFALEPPAGQVSGADGQHAAPKEARDAAERGTGGGFTGGRGHQHAPAAVSGADAGQGVEPFFTPPPLYNRIISLSTRAQHYLRGQMVSFASGIKESPYGTSFWLFLAVSFVYGVVHAIGPGHGKAVVFCYFLGRSGGISRGLLMGNLLTSVHVLSAAVLVFAAHLLFEQGAARGIHGVSGPVQRFSYGIIMLVGAAMLLHALYELFSGRLGGRVRQATAECPAGYGSLTAVSVLAGLVPCPAAVLILTFARGLDITQAGVLALVALALGMGLTTSAFGLLSMVSRRVLLHSTGRSTRAVVAGYALLSVTGALAVTLLGFIMYTGSV
ncbi:high-affinity nickel-transporter [Oleidesulfovibrio alaskensis G20]|jgi:ABC-type nickel/cobalt efflux system permease component RcnA|uniref:Nickel/cobalt efflux system n=1 Tax=Oleidesulfovibrio alaskensis (strain ATCC BAA-1058 / DSM 17464 / G20) TaxID=207559 RepID=Q316R0_OLEA2|nr:high-affinity nickel-transporter [Oleidesulfovibrio alaskensis]ABB37086.1 high-affinity nickel-transporter [Oleidesulfovibrio alaskensis G20]MBG0772973.1 hypothetical protein [Oleidesulfovibrio alaskensis]